MAGAGDGKVAHQRRASGAICWVYRQQLKTNKLVASLSALRIHPMDQLPLRLWQLSLCTGAAYKHKKAKPSTRKPCLLVSG